MAQKLDFLLICSKFNRQGVLEIYPKFIIKKSKDLMIRGSDFYAIWDAEKGLWSTDEQDAIRLIDSVVDEYAKESGSQIGPGGVSVHHMWDSETKLIDNWHHYCQKQLRDNFCMLDEKIIFSNDVVTKEDYASKRLSYPLTPGDISAYDRLIGVLYDPEERHKLEWAIGSIVTGDSKRIQKFIVLYGIAGSGKSTVLNIIQQLFEGYYSVFDAKALGSSSNAFALEPFTKNPLVAIQHDGDLSKIEDNTRLNSIVSHEIMTVNEKFKSAYSNQFKAFLFVGSNKPVKITDAKSGLIRRLIDVVPSGNKVSSAEYDDLVEKIKFELGAIACHCRDVYLENPRYYDGYIPINMLTSTNDFFNFVLDSYDTFAENDGVSLKVAWEMYKHYSEDANIPYQLPKRIFQEELRNYFDSFEDRYTLPDGTRVRSYYKGFKTERFESVIMTDSPKSIDIPEWLVLTHQMAVFDVLAADWPAQYAVGTENPRPSDKWDNVTTKLSDLDTSKIHYVLPPMTHIVIDFDLKDENGNKNLELNLKAASKWPKTYAEVSQGGQGLHLHYIYDGDDPTTLSPVFEPEIEVKVFTGKSSLRRRLSLCNAEPVASISSGLPRKVAKKVVDFKKFTSEKKLRNDIERNLRKEIHANTRPSMDFIKKLLDDAYESGQPYDVSDMKNEIIAFAAQSTNQSNYCLKLINEMHFTSETPPDAIAVKDEELGQRLIFFDIEIFPNLFVICWKIQGTEEVTSMINPTAEQVAQLAKFRLVGFNCKRYDNHICYAAMLGYSVEQLYELSQKIINGHEKGAMFGAAYDLSYTDIYDFASAGNKMSLKKLEIKMGIHHHELGLPWNKPVPKELWDTVVKYCKDDVRATEAAFTYLDADWTARQILADLAGMNYNTSTNTLTGKIIFGDEKKPQAQFCYRNLAEPVHDLDPEVNKFLNKVCPEMMAYPWGKEKSLLPYFEGYKYDAGVSIFLGEEVGEGGRVSATPGIHYNVALLDIASMHPHSAIAECLFGPEFTRSFVDIVEGRVDIKHESWDKVDNMLGGKLRPYIQKVKDGKMSSKDLANGLKTAINAVYGLTAAKFDNLFRDIRNKDNIVAKRGALVMMVLEQEVKARGFVVAHVKTDSIKIPDATNEIIDFVMRFGERFGYTFEHEATYEKMCLVNDAVYIAKYATIDHCKALYDGFVPGDNAKHPGEWTATGTQFAVPYVFKTLFSKEPITFHDCCETKSASTAIYLDLNENLPEDEHSYKFIGKVGEFSPVLSGHGGGLCLRINGDELTEDSKFSAVGGTKDYRWLESEMVEHIGGLDIIDLDYYRGLVEDAREAIGKYGDIEQFVSDDSLPPELPWDEFQWKWSEACLKTCCGLDCRFYYQTENKPIICTLGYPTYPF